MEEASHVIVTYTLPTTKHSFLYLCSLLSDYFHMCAHLFFLPVSLVFLLREPRWIWWAKQNSVGFWLSGQRTVLININIGLTLGDLSLSLSIMISMLLDNSVKLSKPYFPYLSKELIPAHRVVKYHELFCTEYLLNGTACVLKVSKYTLGWKIGHNVV